LLSVPTDFSERDAQWARLEKTSFLIDDEKRAAIGYGPLPTQQKFNPGQLRKPSGNPGGGQWTKPGGDGGGENDGDENDPDSDDHHLPDISDLDDTEDDPNYVPVARRPSIPTTPPTPKQQQKVPKSGQSGADAARDTPSWVKGNVPKVGESSDAFAQRMMEKNYPGQTKFERGADSEFSKIKKWADRHFEDPKP
jgi:hypothetical protein